MAYAGINLCSGVNSGRDSIIMRRAISAFTPTQGFSFIPRATLLPIRLPEH
jgi:hypothetical protein